MTIFKNLNTFFSMSTMETILIYKFHTGFDTKGAICVTANFNCLKIQVESTSLCIQLIFYKSLCQIIISLKDLCIQWSFWLNSTPILNFNMHTRPYISILKCYFEYTFRMIFSCDLATCILCGKKNTKASNLCQNFHLPKRQTINLPSLM